MLETISPVELILNPDNSIYHLALRPEDLAPIVLTVGDPARVLQVSKHFDSIEVKKVHREFVTHTGYLGKQRITVLSTGMGTGNIDIVMNELDALVNIDFVTQQAKAQLTSLTIIRLGTTGALQANIAVGENILSRFAIGLDGLLNFYNLPMSAETQQLQAQFLAHFNADQLPITPYITEVDATLSHLFAKHFTAGITVTCGGFYASQGRRLRAAPRINRFIEKLSQLNFTHRVTNLEMETAAIYGLGTVLGHRCCSLSTVLANRMTQKFSADPKAAIDNMIQQALQEIEKL